MRLRIILGIMVVAVLVVVIGSDGYGQQFQFKGGGGGFPGGGGGFPGGGKRGNGGGMGFGQMDPNQRFDGYAQGRPYFLISDIQGFTQSLLTQYAQEQKVTFPNGQVSREQYLAFSDYLKNKAASGGFNMFKKGPTPGGPTPAGTPPAGATLESLQQLADLDFKTHDSNGDGKLNTDEMPQQLRRDLARWDRNNDGQIDLEEYRGYFITRAQEAMARGQNGSAGMQQFGPGAIDAVIDDELDKRPVVFRAGKLPTKGLPPWFVQLDTDADGQAALYEWRAAGRDLDDFGEWDRDNDGFITPEEAMHAYAAITKTPDPLLAANQPDPTMSAGKSFNKGNKGNNGFNKGNKGGPGGNPAFNFFNKGKGGGQMQFQWNGPNTGSDSQSPSWGNGFGGGKGGGKGGKGGGKGGKGGFGGG